jgi:hypothetical protein
MSNIIIENTTDNDDNYAFSLGNSKYYNRLWMFLTEIYH